jgi:ferrous iron transport protein B
MLKKTRIFAGDPSPFLIELPAYHAPRPKGVLRIMLERGWAFVKRAGTIILLATMGVWFFSSFGFGEDGFGMVDMTESMLAAAGSAVAWIFAPLGWGGWQETVATVTGLIAKENVVGTFGVLFSNPEVSEDGFEIWGQVAESFGLLSGGFAGLAAFSFVLFNLLCAPCFAAIGAIHREMASTNWTFIAVGYQCLFAYCVAFSAYQIGLLFAGGGFGVGTVIAFALVAVFCFLLFRPDPSKRGGGGRRGVLDAAQAQAE